MTTLFAAAILVLASTALALGRRLRTLRRRMAELESRLAPNLAEPDRDEGLRLFAAVDHELRGPLGAITGYQELLADDAYGTLDPAGRDAVQRIGHAANELLRLIDVAVDLARLDAGEATPARTPADPDRILREAIDASRAFAAERQTDLDLEPPSDLPRVETDPLRLGRALGLAITAAIRATPGGTLHIRWAHPRQPPILEIAGTGLPPGAAATGGRAAVRLDLAVRLLGRLGGRVRVLPGDAASASGASTLRLELPRPAGGAARAIGSD